VHEDPTLGEGNNQITGVLYYRLNENWATRISERIDARNGNLQEQYYTIYRDLRSWTAGLTFRVRNNLNGPQDFGVAVTFSLKAFPRYGGGRERETPSLLLGS
jgi:hypothetical protein